MYTDIRTDTDRDQWSRIRSPEINTMMANQFSTRGQDTSMGAKWSFFSENDAVITGCPLAKKNTNKQKTNQHLLAPGGSKAWI